MRKGLEVGQKVVVSGQFLIDSEASLKGTQTRMGDSAVTAPVMKPTEPVHHGVGKVEKIDPDQVTISHGPIASLQWGPMTMGFKLPPNGLPKNVAVGDSVNFDIKAAKEGQFAITTITPVATKP